MCSVSAVLCFHGSSVKRVCHLSIGCCSDSLSAVCRPHTVYKPESSPRPCCVVLPDSQDRHSRLDGVASCLSALTSSSFAIRNSRVVDSTPCLGGLSDHITRDRSVVGFSSYPTSSTIVHTCGVTFPCRSPHQPWGYLFRLDLLSCGLSWFPRVASWPLAAATSQPGCETLSQRTAHNHAKIHSD
jgi:hypothetical protein